MILFLVLFFGCLSDSCIAGFMWLNSADNKTAQGSFLLSSVVGSELRFVSRDSGQEIDIKLLKADMDYFINEQYRFFVPHLQTPVCYNLQQEEVMNCHYHQSWDSTVENLTKRSKNPLFWSQKSLDFLKDFVSKIHPFSGISFFDIFSVVKFSTVLRQEMTTPR